jgi:nucleoside-diphosphate-sugar epimerase
MIHDEAQLEQMLSDPTEAATAAVAELSGDILLLGAGGKMGPSLARMVRRASDEAQVERRVIAVSRFGDRQLEAALQRTGVATLRGDLLDETFVASLPDAPNVIFMTGSKFGTSGNASMTWAMNVYLPSVVCRRYRSSRILVFSSGNVYPFVPSDGDGSVEDDTLQPVGEYGMSVLGRERMFEYFSRRDSIPVSIVRLNYAVEMRYGVLVDLAQQVLAQQPVDLTMGFVNVIWQGDANAMSIAALADADTPPTVVNVAGPERLSVEQTSEQFGQLMNRPVCFVGSASETALLSNARKAFERYGRPRVSTDQIIPWTANWIQRGECTLSKPTHFQVRDGKF